MEHIIRNWFPEDDEECLKELTLLYEKNFQEISKLLFTYDPEQTLIAVTHQEVKDPLDPILRAPVAYFHPTLFDRMAPSSKHSVIAEKICNSYDNFISSILKYLKSRKSRGALKESSKARLISENIRLKKELNEKEEQLQKATINYYKELTTLREQIYIKKKYGTETCITAHYFSVQQGLPESMCTLLNARLDELRAELMERIDESSKTILKLHQEVERYRALTPKDYPLAIIPVLELCKNIKLLYNDNKEELWNGIFHGFGIEIILEMIEKATGSQGMLPIEKLRMELDSIRKEALEQISTISYKDQFEIKRLQGKLYENEGLLEAAKKELEEIKNKKQQEKTTVEKVGLSKETIKSASLLDVALKKWKYRSLIQKFLELNSELLSPLHRPESERYEKISIANVFLQQELNQAKNETKYWQDQIYRVQDKMEEIKQEFIFANEQRRVLQEKNSELELALEHSRWKIEEKANIGIEIENIEMLQKEAMENGDKCKPIFHMAVMTLLKYSLINSINTNNEQIRKMIMNNQLQPKKSQAMGTITEIKDITHRILDAQLEKKSKQTTLSFPIGVQIYNWEFHPTTSTIMQTDECKFLIKERDSFYKGNLKNPSRKNTPKKGKESTVFDFSDQFLGQKFKPSPPNKRNSSTRQEKNSDKNYQSYGRNSSRHNSQAPFIQTQTLPAGDIQFSKLKDFNKTSSPEDTPKMKPAYNYEGITAEKNEISSKRRPVTAYESLGRNPQTLAYDSEENVGENPSSKGLSQYLSGENLIQANTAIRNNHLLHSEKEEYYAGKQKMNPMGLQKQSSGRSKPNHKFTGFLPLRVDGTIPRVGGFNYDRMKEHFQMSKVQSEVKNHYKNLQTYNTPKGIKGSHSQFLIEISDRSKKQIEPNVTYFHPLNFESLSPSTKTFLKLNQRAMPKNSEILKKL